MKLKVKKVNRLIEVEITTSTEKKPIKFSLTPESIEAIVSTLQTVTKMDGLTLELDL